MLYRNAALDVGNKCVSATSAINTKGYRLQTVVAVCTD